MVIDLDYQTVASFVGSFRLLFFVITFAVILAWVFKPGNKAEHDKHANIPLKDD